MNLFSRSISYTYLKALGASQNGPRVKVCNIFQNSSNYRTWSLSPSHLTTTLLTYKTVPNLIYRVPHLNLLKTFSTPTQYPLSMIKNNILKTNRSLKYFIIFVKNGTSTYSSPQFFQKTIMHMNMLFRYKL